MNHSALHKLSGVSFTRPPNFWNSIENRKKFLDDISIKLKINNPRDWGKITTQKISDLGGHTLLIIYQGSLFNCLQNMYRNIEWKKEWFTNIKKVPKRHWNLIENRRKCMEEIKIKFNIKEPKDWGKLTNKNIQEAGGTTLLSLYKNSLFRCLKSLYPDIQWKKEWFTNNPYFSKSHWVSIENRKNFLNKVAQKLNIKKPKDWGKITAKDIQELGGNSLIMTYYQGSLFLCLSNVFKDIEWKREWFSTPPRLPSNYWMFLENRRKFLDEIAVKCEVQNPKDWGKVPIQRILEMGGRSLLYTFNNSLYACLSSVYTDIDWKREWFPTIPKFSKNHWNSEENCKKFLDEIALTSNVQSTQDWRKITTSLIKNKGGVGLLNKYTHTLRLLLEKFYPNLNWNETWIKSNRVVTEMHLQGLLERVFPYRVVLLNQRKHKNY